MAPSTEQKCAFHMRWCTHPPFLLPASRPRQTAKSPLRDHIYSPTYRSTTANVSMGNKQHGLPLPLRNVRSPSPPNLPGPLPTHTNLTPPQRPHSLREKLRLIVKATRQHARNLATFALLYKSTLLALRHLPTFSQPSSSSSSSSFGLGPPRKEGRYDTFLAGLVGGYAVFGRGRGAQSSVNQQIVIYVFARVVLALAKLSVQPGGWVGGVVEVVDGNERGAGAGGGRGGGGGGGGGGRMARNAWPVFASLSWAFVMWLFRWYPDTLQASLRSSMKYMYVIPPFSLPFLAWVSLAWVVMGGEVSVRERMERRLMMGKL